MEEFLLVFRRDTQELPQTDTHMQQIMQQWKEWLDSIAAQDKLTSIGNRLALEGNVVKPGGMVINGPYVEMKESIGGFIMVKAKDLAEATEIAKGCPILTIGGNVEVRMITDSGLERDKNR